MSSTMDSDVEAEASAWFARLNSHKVELQTLLDFQIWRRDPLHDAAYERVKKIWEAAGAVRNDPAVADALREAKARIAKAREKEGLPLPVILTSLLGLLLVGGLLATQRFGTAATQRYETSVGQERRITLSDGSAVSLDTHSAVEVRYSRGERWVRLLKGQAMFDVAHRPSWPFHVQADGLELRDVGTVFTVRKDNGRALVTVVSGAVSVSAPGRRASWILSAGQQIASDGPPRPHAVDVNAFTRWTTGRVEFDDVSLADAVREMNRYAVHPMVLVDDGVGRLRVSGAFNATDIRGFAKALTEVYGIDVKARADGGLTISAQSRSTRT